MPRKRKPPARSTTARATPRREQFPLEYLVDLNATQAAIRCGYSPKSAHAQGWRLLREEKVQEKITELMAQRNERVETHADRVLREVDDLALGEIGDILDFSKATISIRPANEISDRGRRLMSQVTIQTRHKKDGSVRSEVVAFKLWNKPAALHLAMQHRGLLVSKHSLTDGEGRPIPVTQNPPEFIIRFVDPATPEGAGNGGQ